SIFRPSKELNPTVHWRRDPKRDFDTVVHCVSCPSTVAAVFDNPDQVVAFIKELRQEDLGLSINISAALDKAQECARRAGLERHSVGIPVAFVGQTHPTPDRQTLEPATVRGHGVPSSSLIRKLLDWLKLGRRSPHEACAP